MEIKINDALINYDLVGTGKPLTMIHGLGENLNAWYNQVPVFSKYYRVLTYDVRGHRRSELPAQEITTDILIEDLSSLLKTMDTKETLLLGHSMGGSTALQFAVAYPDIVKALILCNCAGPGPDSKEIHNTIEAVKKNGVKAIIKEWTNNMFSTGFAEKHPEIIEQYKSILQQINPDNFLRFIQPMAQPKDRFKETTNPREIKCPTLIIVGEYDPLSGPASGRELQNAIIGSQLKIFSTGHAPAVEQPEEFNKTVLDFLSTVI